jgi:hypothetical protein
VVGYRQWWATTQMASVEVRVNSGVQVPEDITRVTRYKFGFVHILPEHVLRVSGFG